MKSVSYVGQDFKNLMDGKIKDMISDGSGYNGNILGCVKLSNSYEFVKNFISDPGSETKSNNWTGYKNLSIGELLIFYGKVKIANETIEYLEITNPEMLDFTVGERVMKATG